MEIVYGFFRLIKFQLNQNLPITNNSMKKCKGISRKNGTIVLLQRKRKTINMIIRFEGEKFY